MFIVMAKIKCTLLLYDFSIQSFDFYRILKIWTSQEATKWSQQSDKKLGRIDEQRTETGLSWAGSWLHLSPVVVEISLPKLSTSCWSVIRLGCLFSRNWVLEKYWNNKKYFYIDTDISFEDTKITSSKAALIHYKFVLFCFLICNFVTKQKS